MLPSVISSLIGEDLTKVDLHLKSLLESDNSLISQIGNYICQSGGKRVRPILLLLSARMAGCQNPQAGDGYRGQRERAIHLASIIEFIHAATLLHDDVIDNANLRRGNPSANQKWGNQLPVLVGDYLYATSFYLLVKDRDTRIMEAVSSATATVTDGEILQLQKTGDLGIREEEYIEIIAKKTSCLMAASCRIGALLGGVSEEQVEALHAYGTDVGIAFQLVDDLLDYVSHTETIGKPVNNDLQGGNCTLPLIRTLQVASSKEIDRIRQVLSQPVYSPEDVAWIVSLIKTYGADKFTLDRAAWYVRQAKERLAVFADSAYRQALLDFSDYIVQRDF
ncbi:MAG: polyprenyl synthetase family protein [bacterium]